MYNPGEDDNELDRLSREAAAGYKVPGAPDWDAMQERLDKIMPEENKKRRFLVLWGLLPALILGGIVAYYQQNDGPVTAASATKSSSGIPTSIQSGIAAGVPPVKQIHEIAVPKEISTGNNVPHTNTSLATFSLSISKKFGFSPAASGVNTPTSSNSAFLAKSLPVNPAVSETIPADQVVTNVKAEDPKETPAAIATVEKIQETAINNTPVKTETPIVTTAKKSNTGKAWSLGIVASVDESTVKLKYAYEPGYGLGVLAGYHFNKIFSLYSGAIYTQKNYKMAGDDFTVPKGSWISYGKLETVEGYCRMWEVPLLARFYTSHSDKKGVFLSTGISSYFMTRENYTYGYQYMGQPVSKTLDYTSSTTHILSILNFSAGFESTVGKNVYLQIEPYAKLPLGGVGTGSIQLSSFGVNVGVQMRKPIRK